MRKALREMKNVVYQYNEIELLVREATNNDRFMVSNNVLANIARATNDYQEYPSLFAMLWKRLTDLEHVMHVQKALHVVEYLLRHGAERFINDAKRRARDIAALQKYKHYDEQNQDDAKEARARAKAVYALLMDDQLLAQERGKSARLASEHRLGGSGHEAHGNTYDDEDQYVDDDGEYRQQARPAQAAAPARRAPPSSTTSNGAARSAAPTTRRRQESDDDEDPFDTPAPTAAKPKPKTAAPAKSATKQQLDVDEPVDEDDPEAVAAAAKKAKKEKKKKKKEEEARKLAEEQAAATKAASKSLKTNGASSSASPPAANGADLDLMAFSDASASPFGGEVDIMTGMAHPSNGGKGGDLSDLFQNQSLNDSPLFFQNGNGHANGGDGEETDAFPGEGEIEGRTDPSPKLRTATSAASSAASPTGGLVNLNDLLADAPIRSKKESVDSGVSMSMMRSIQPLGAPATKSSTSSDPMNNKRRISNIPSSVPLGSQYALTGFMQHPSGMMGPGGPGGPAYGAYPGLGGPPLGPGGYPAQQPMMAIMPPGHQYQGGPPLGPGGPPMMGGYAGQPGPAMGYPPNPYGHPQPQALPFSSYPPSSSSATFTQMRPAPKQQNGIPIFDVTEAPPARAVEPTRYH